MQININLLTLLKYIIIILIALLIGWNIRISTNDDCTNNICPPEEYIEGDKSDHK